MGEDVELCLEVQVDPASKKILANPDKCRSVLLDVTVVKPKEVEAFGTRITSVLRADEVRKLITSLEKQRRKKQKVLDKLKYDDTIIKIRKHEEFYDSLHRSRKPFTRHRERISSNTPIDNLERKDFIGIAESVEPLFCEIRRSLKNVETRITNMQDINLVISQTTVDETASEEFLCSKSKKSSPLPSCKGLKNQSCYRVETAPHDLKSLLLSQNKQTLLDRGDKIEGKCFCENCGIVGLLSECQKRPLLTELAESAPPSSHKQFYNLKKKTRFNVVNCEDSGRWKPSTKSTPTEKSYISHLSNRVKLLENRLAMQEEKVVPKEYFKRIITKMVTNFSPRISKTRSDTSLHYSEKSRKMPTREKSPKPTPCSTKCHQCKSTCCFNANISPVKEKKPKRNNKSTITDDEVYYGGFTWKWGEEILKPGIDLKNRIVNLLNEILSKFALTEAGSAETTKVAESVKGEQYNSETFKRFMRHVNPKVFSAHVETPKFLSTDYDKLENHFEPLQMGALSDFSRSREEVPEKLKEYQPRKESEKYNKNIDISYVNPKLSLWRTESPNAYKTDEKVAEQKSYAIGKQEFLKIVAKAKQAQKDVLWKNIWNQAKANGQHKKDKITIKIPCQNKDSKGRQKMFETEMCIGEVEEILKGGKA